MHKGRSYPYHWIYWGTECFFFPGYIPWQLLILPGNTNTGIYYSMNQTWPITTQGFRASSDATQMKWLDAYGTTPVEHHLIISVEQQRLLGKDWIVFKGIETLEIVPMWEAWYFQPAPSRDFFLPVSQWWTTHDPYGPRDGPIFGFQPASWSQITSQPHG